VAFGIFLWGLRKTTKASVRITGVPAETRKEHFLNANVER
jgi:hypothetical protein